MILIILYQSLNDEQRLPSLEAALLKVAPTDSVCISAIIEGYSELPILKEQSVYKRSVAGTIFMTCPILSR